MNLWKPLWLLNACRTAWWLSSLFLLVENQWPKPRETWNAMPCKNSCWHWAQQWAWRATVSCQMSLLLWDCLLLPKHYLPLITFRSTRTVLSSIHSMSLRWSRCWRDMLPHRKLEQCRQIAVASFLMVVLVCTEILMIEHYTECASLQ